MMRSLVTYIHCAAFLTLVGCSFNGGAVPAEREQVLIALEDSKDFGVVNTPQTLEHTFLLRNDSDQPVRIKQIKAACSCAAVEPPAVVETHGTAPVKVSLSTSNRQGVFATYVDVLMADANMQPIRLRMSFFGRPKCGCDPPELFSTQSTKVGRVDIPFRLISKIDDVHGMTAAIPVFRYPEMDIQCAVDQVTLSPQVKEGLRKVEYKCRCSIDLGALASAGSKRVSQSFLISGMPYQVSDLSVPVTVEFLKHPVVTGPELLTVSRSRNESAELTTQVWSISGQPIHIERAETSNDSITAQVLDTAGANACEIVVRTRPEYWSTFDGPKKESIRIYTVESSAEPYTIDLQMLP